MVWAGHNLRRGLPWHGLIWAWPAFSICCDGHWAGLCCALAVLGMDWEALVMVLAGHEIEWVWAGLCFAWAGQRFSGLCMS
jgi:hypothetical protein